MVLLTFALLGISAMAWKGMLEDNRKDSANRRVRTAGYSLNRFEDVLICSNVKRKKQDGFKYLPANGWRAAIAYIRRQPYTTEKDEVEFKNHYEKVRQQELDRIKNHWKDEYEKAHNEYLSSPESTQEFIFEKKFYAFFSEQFVKDLADELYEKTFMGDMAVTRPKVAEIKATNEAYVMVWVLRCSGGSYKAKEYFKVCCRYLGKPID